MKEIEIKVMFLLNVLIISNIAVLASIYPTSEAAIDDNITTSIKPQGASIGDVQNESSTASDKPNSDVADNITTSIKPQGASIGNQT